MLHPTVNLIRSIRNAKDRFIFLSRFIINDIHQQLKENQCQLLDHVYRTMLMSSDELR
jgi:hypothetical protein